MSINKLSTKARAQMLNMLCGGLSMRSVSRLADVSINTVAKLLIDAGKFCAAFHDDKVVV
jgi:transposase-like protein